MKPDPAIAALREALEQRLDALAARATETVFAEVPAYRAAGAQLRDDVREHIVSHLRASLESFASGRDVTREDLLFVRPHAARRAKRVSVSEFVRAFYIGERTLWDAALELAQDDASRRAVLALSAHLPRYFEVATTHAAEVYVEAQEQLAATGERIRRDLLEDLLAGRTAGPGPRLDAARAAGIRQDASYLVISATPCSTPLDEQLLRGGAAALRAAAATGTGTGPLTVVRHDEIVAVVPISNGMPEALEQRIATAQQRLAQSGLPLTVGVSSTVSGPSEIPDAYREANIVRVARGARPGVVALSAMSAFEYLTLRPDATASRLIAPAIHAFLAEDAEHGAQLLATVREYVASDLNVRRAAENLHIHVNTAHYRLTRIAERTGCDLRRVGDLIEILIAARLADAARGG